MNDLPENKVAAEADKVIKTLEAILVPLAQNAIIAAVPGLGLPVVKQITEAIEQSLADKLTKLAETGITFAIIDLQTDHEQGNMSDAIKELEAAIKSGDPDAIAQAKAKFDSAQDALVVDDGGATPN